ncbi:hypothetical protein LSAT2_012064 [Lamellibrachia satsuma]|nr:hypothetical protein LSAT2_012064 [Lamellibrachia satsuma]
MKKFSSIVHKTVINPKTKEDGDKKGYKMYDIVEKVREMEAIWDTALGNSAAIQRWETALGYSAGIQRWDRAWDTAMGYSVGYSASSPLSAPFPIPIGMLACTSLDEILESVCLSVIVVCTGLDSERKVDVTSAPD